MLVTVGHSNMNKSCSIMGSSPLDCRKKPNVTKIPLIKLTSEHLFKILKIFCWGIGNIPRNSFSQIEKDNKLGNKITKCSKFAYAKKAKATWDATWWEHKSNTATCI